MNCKLQQNQENGFYFSTAWLRKASFHFTTVHLWFVINEYSLQYNFRVVIFLWLFLGRVDEVAEFEELSLRVYLSSLVFCFSSVHCNLWALIWRITTWRTSGDSEIQISEGVHNCFCFETNVHIGLGFRIFPNETSSELF